MGVGARRFLFLVLLLALVGFVPAAPVRAGDERPLLEMVSAPSVEGAPRYGNVLVADPGRWRPRPSRHRFEWLRDGVVVDRGARYAIRPRDVGHRIALRVTVFAYGYRPTTRRVVVGRALHRVPLRRTVFYSVRTKGTITTSVARFKKRTQQTYDDARGWRGRGVRFVRVRSGGAFTLWLAQAELVPSFSSECSVEWSCRVGRNVIINQTRWKHASPAWNAARLTLRGYQHMVVNHETGHWLGFGHATCPRRGALAPVMMQQSKGTGGCRFNPFPTLAELRRVVGRRAQLAVHARAWS